MLPTLETLPPCCPPHTYHEHGHVAEVPAAQGGDIGLTGSQLAPLGAPAPHAPQHLEVPVGSHGVRALPGVPQGHSHWLGQIPHSTAICSHRETWSGGQVTPLHLHPQRGWTQGTLHIPQARCHLPMRTPGMALRCGSTSTMPQRALQGTPNTPNTPPCCPYRSRRR